MGCTSLAVGMPTAAARSSVPRRGKGGESLNPKTAGAVLRQLERLAFLRPPGPPRAWRLVRHQSNSCSASPRLWDLSFLEIGKASNISCHQPCHLGSIFFWCPFHFHNLAGTAFAKSCEHGLMQWWCCMVDATISGFFQNTFWTGQLVCLVMFSLSL